MKRIGVMANVQKPAAAEVLRRLAVKAAALNLELVATPEAGAFLSGAAVRAAGELGGAVDVLMALGGDGTMLHAVRMLDGADTPVLGVNLGSLGFMTSVTEKALEHAVDVLAANQYTVSRRSLLACHVERQGDTKAHYLALNDVVVGWGASSRAMTLGLVIDGEEVAQYLCDGLVVATPTGSTGHSLSAGGPIIHPESPVFNVNVICPHTLSGRPLVLPDRCRITVHMLDLPPQKQPLLSADGQGEFVLEQGDVVHVARHTHVASFVHLPEYRYFSVLRQKLHWQGSAKSAIALTGGKRAT